MGFSLEGMPKDLIIPEKDVWEILERDRMREPVLNDGFVGMVVDIRPSKQAEPMKPMFIVRFSKPTTLETMALDPKWFPQKAQ